MNYEQRRKRTMHFVTLCLCFLFCCFLPPRAALLPPGHKKHSAGGGRISAPKLRVEAQVWGETLQQPGCGQSCLSTGSRWRNGVAANLPLAIQRPWISSMGGNHFDIGSLANWLPGCRWNEPRCQVARKSAVPSAKVAFVGIINRADL